MAKRTPSILHQTRLKTGFFRFGGGLTGRIFNPSLISLDKDYLVARWSHDKSPGGPWGMNSIWAFELDSDHRPIKGTKIGLRGYRNQHFEDPRIFQRADGNLWLSYCTFVMALKNGPDGGQVPSNDPEFKGAHQGCALLDRNFNVISQMDPVYGGNGETVLMQSGHEKNWLWFEHEGVMYCVYMTCPHEVFRLGPDMRSKDVFISEFKSDYQFHWGQPRGGTPPVRVRDEYWSFFHSSTPWKNGRRQYHMGAYAFKAQPPFEVVRVTPRPILSGSDQDPWMHYHPPVVFPCGALYNKGNWLVSMGINDMASAWIEIPHDKLIQLVPKKTKAKRQVNHRIQPILTGVEEGLFISGMGRAAVPGPQVPGASGYIGEGIAGKHRRPKRRRIGRRHRPGVRNDQGVQVCPVQAP